MLVIVAPGQGAQTPGFLVPWLEDDVLASRLHWLSTVAGIDLAHHGTVSDADTIRDTRIAQPLLVATALVATLELFPHPADGFAHVGAVAGHSVGELAAAVGSRAITAEMLLSARTRCSRPTTHRGPGTSRTVSGAPGACSRAP